MHCFLHHPPPPASRILASFLEHPPPWSLPLISCSYLIPSAECLVGPILIFLLLFPKHLDTYTQLFLKYFTLGFFSHKHLTGSSWLPSISLESQWTYCTSDYKADWNSDLWIRSSCRRVALGENVGWSFNSHTDSVYCTDSYHHQTTLYIKRQSHKESKHCAQSHSARFDGEMINLCGWHVLNLS